MRHNKPFQLLLLFGPILLSLFCLSVSLLGFDVSVPFDTDPGSPVRAPGTYMSLFLMFSCLVAAVTGAMQNTTSRSLRRFALIVSVLLIAAMLDDYFQGHGLLGGFLQRLNWQRPHPYLSVKWMHYAADVPIVLGAIVGSIVCYRLMASAKDDPLRRQLLWFIIATALGKGILNVLSHRHYLWALIWPGIRFEDVYQMLEQLSCFKEWSKLWCEWFVLLYLLRLFHNRSFSAVWSFQLLTGSVLATAGLWFVPSRTGVVPYLVLGSSDFAVVRNYHLLAVVACVWLIWGFITWNLVQGDGEKIVVAGAFWLLPLPFVLCTHYDPQVYGALIGLLLGVLLGRERWTLALVSLGGVAATLTGLKAPLVLTTIMGLATGCLVFSKEEDAGLLFGVTGVFAVTSVIWMAVQGIHVGFTSTLLAGGLLLPVAWYSMVRSKSTKIVPVAILALAAILTASPALLALLCFLTMALWSSRLPEQQEVTLRKAAWPIAVCHLLFVSALLFVNFPELLPNAEHTPKHSIKRFTIGYQRVHAPLPW